MLWLRRVDPLDARDGSIGRQSASGKIAARRRRRTTADTRSAARGPLQSWHAHGGIAVSIHPNFAPTHDKGAGRSNPVAQHHSVPAAHRAPVTGSAASPRDGSHRRAAARGPAAELGLRRGSPLGSKAARCEALGPRSRLSSVARGDRGVAPPIRRAARRRFRSGRSVLHGQGSGWRSRPGRARQPRRP